MRYFCILFLVTYFLPAQKVVKKSLLNSSITTFQIDVSNCYEMHMKTGNSADMKVTATIDGEYKNDLVLHVNEEGNTVFISTGFQPNFKNTNDKLSAHKVVSIALDITIPENKVANVFGLSCNVNVAGNYKKLKIALNDGACNLFKVSENAEVRTQSGNIKAESAAATIKSSSKYGKIIEDEIPKGKDSYTLSTITGNISLKRIE